MDYASVGHALGVNPNMLRCGASTGTILIRWEGARRPTIWTVPSPDMKPLEARLELARRYLHVFGPGTAAAFAQWAGIKPPRGPLTFDALLAELTPVRTPIGEAWIMSSDEQDFRSAVDPTAAAPARLLPSGDAYFLLQGRDRELLVPEADRRGTLWTSRVWPGAVLVEGEIVGTWRRAGADLTVQAWGPLSPEEREAVESEAASLPLPDLGGPVVVRWA